MSVHRDWRLRIEDIIEYARSIEAMTAGMDEATWSRRHGSDWSAFFATKSHHRAADSLAAPTRLGSV